MTDNTILNSVPVVVRARGFRLYTQGGNRLVDLWLNGGAAVLGHTPPNLLRELKNTASRGLFAPLPHFTESRYIKALSRLFPGRSFRLYAAPPPELAELFKSGAAKLWRPFADAASGEDASPEDASPEDASPFAAEKDTPLFVPVLPGILSWREDLPLGLCAAAAESESRLLELPAGDILSPVLLSAAARGVYDILASPERAKPSLPRVEKAMRTDGFRKRWKRQGIYLYPKEKMENDEWAALFGQFLEAGFLLPPSQTQPLILPGELSPGEEAKLTAALTASL